MLIVQQLEHVRVVLHGKIQKSLNVFFAGGRRTVCMTVRGGKKLKVSMLSLSQKRKKKSRSVVINFKESFSD